MQPISNIIILTDSSLSFICVKYTDRTKQTKKQLRKTIKSNMYENAFLITI